MNALQTHSWSSCPYCYGTGSVFLSERVARCPRCAGEGSLQGVETEWERRTRDITAELLTELAALRKVSFT
jgi:DnaJ-class molecular chaperone